MSGKKTIYSQILSPSSDRPFFSLYGRLLLLFLPPSAFLLLFSFLRHDRALVNALITHVTSPFKQAIAALCAPLPFAMAEVIWAGAVLLLVGFVLRSLFLVGRSLLHRLQGRHAHPLRRLIRRSLALLLALLVVYSGYTAGWGINYYGDSFSHAAGLEKRKMTTGELYALTCAFARECSDLSGQVARDEAGLFTLSREDLFARSDGMYEAVYDRFPSLDVPATQAKPMFFSRLMSRLGFTGFYFPFTGESLVNVDAPAATIPCTILHELAHQKNVALEDECDFLAIVVGLESDDPEFRYSSAITGYIHLGNALFSADRALWRESRALLSQEALADLSYISAYWAQFESPASEAAEAVYTGFAESFEQEDIMKSYGACIDLLAAYYLPSGEEVSE